MARSFMRRPIGAYPCALIVCFVSTIVIGRVFWAYYYPFGGSTFENRMWATFIVSLIICMLFAFFFIDRPGRPGLFRRRVDAAGFAIAEHGVPHCDFELTSDGFIVYFNRMNRGYYKGFNALSRTSGAFASVGALIGMATLGLVSLSQRGTTIEVTADAVIINKKKMRRSQFHSFIVSSTFEGQALPNNYSVLGYTYGNKVYEFGGGWPGGEGQEVASALNTHLRASRPTSAEVSPEGLRGIRPKDF